MLKVFDNLIAKPLMRQAYIAPLCAMIVFCASMAVTYLLQNNAYSVAREIQADQFARKAESVRQRITARMLTYEQVLRGLSSLYISSESVSRLAFRDYVSNIQINKNYPGIQGLGFAVLIPASQISKYIAATQREGFPEFTLRPDGVRDTYTSITYIEPFSGKNLRAFGFDMYSEPVRRAAMERARDQDQLSVSGKVRLIQEDGANVQAGVLMYLPVYRHGLAHLTQSDRRANLMGWVYAPFRMNDLMDKTLEGAKEEVDIEIFNDEPVSADNLLYDSDRINSSAVTDTALFHSAFKIEVADKFWHVRMRSLPKFEESIDTRKVEKIQYLGGVISLLLALLVGGLIFRRQRNIQSEKDKSVAAIAFEIQQGMFVTDEHTIILKVNMAFTHITGYTAEETIGMTPKMLSSGRHEQNFYEALWKSINETGTWKGEIWNRRKCGEVYPEMLTITAVKNKQHVVTNYVASFSDISEAKAAAEKVSQLAYYDQLTNLPNRLFLMDRLRAAMSASERSGNNCALLFVDIDHFKIINDELGHGYGDMLLHRVAQRLRSCVRENDTVSRLGGDEFVVMVEELSADTHEAITQISLVGKKILDSFIEPHQLDAHKYYSSSSIGVTLFSGKQVPMEDLLKRADTAMYEAKRSGRNTIRFFDQKMQLRIDSLAVMERELQNALALKQFVLHYQIQVDTENRPTGVETLIRWIHPVRGMLLPEEFIPLTEKTGQIVSIGHWVLEMACAQIQSWSADPRTCNLTVSVNVSAAQFHHADFMNSIQEAIRHYDVPPKRLKLELTESLMLDRVGEAVEIMNGLSRAGVLFSMDDFGTGYSSFQHLHQLPIDELKIDRFFVNNIHDSSVIVRTIVTMASALGVELIAEGVETKLQYRALIETGCTRFQGNLIGRPVPIEELEESLDQRKAYT